MYDAPQVMSDKNNARLVYGVGGTAVLLLLVWFFTLR